METLMGIELSSRMDSKEMDGQIMIKSIEDASGEAGAAASKPEDAGAALGVMKSRHQDLRVIASAAAGRRYFANVGARGL
jgi:hypothetical protein